MIPQNLIDIISPAGWGGMAIMVVWNYFTTKKKRNAEVEASNLVNMQKVIDTVSSFNDKLEEKIEKLQKRVGALEQTLRKQEFDHQEQIKQIQEDHRAELQKAESYYREKCRECENQKTKREMSNEEYSVELRQEIRNFLVRDFGWKVLLMGDYFDVFANHYRAVVAIVQYHKENKMGIAVIRSDEFCFVSELMYFSDIDEFRKLIIDFL